MTLNDLAQQPQVAAMHHRPAALDSSTYLVAHVLTGMPPVLFDPLGTEQFHRDLSLLLPGERPVQRAKRKG